MPKRCKEADPNENLSDRRRSRVKRFACEHPHCRRKSPPARFVFARDLRRHEATHDADDGSNEKCVYCQDNRVRRLDNLRRHIKTQHRGGILKAVYDGDKETFAWCIANYPNCINVISARLLPGEAICPYDQWRNAVFGGLMILNRAIGWEDLDIVRFLLDCGVDVNKADHWYFQTALHSVVSGPSLFTKQKLNILKLLL
ncbi:hypothetical protein V8F33_013092 [Rhypophila sp. PSN 637]